VTYRLIAITIIALTSFEAEAAKLNMKLGFCPVADGDGKVPKCCASNPCETEPPPTPAPPPLDPEPGCYPCVGTCGPGPGGGKVCSDDPLDPDAPTGSVALLVARAAGDGSDCWAWEDEAGVFGECVGPVELSWSCRDEVCESSDGLLWVEPTPDVCEFGDGCLDLGDTFLDEEPWDESLPAPCRWSGPTQKCQLWCPSLKGHGQMLNKAAECVSELDSQTCQMPDGTIKNFPGAASPCAGVEPTDAVEGLLSGDDDEVASLPSCGWTDFGAPEPGIQHCVYKCGSKTASCLSSSIAKKTVCAILSPGKDQRVTLDGVLTC
jgi:hypothetical protein